MKGSNLFRYKQLILTQQQLALEQEKEYLRQLEFYLTLKQQLAERRKKHEDEVKAREQEQQEERYRREERHRQRIAEIERIDYLSRYQKRTVYQDTVYSPSSPEEMKKQAQLRQVEAQERFAAVLAEKCERQRRREAEFDRKIQSAEHGSRSLRLSAPQSARGQVFYKRTPRKIPRLVTTADDAINW